MAGLGSLEHDLDGLTVAHFADQNYLGRLAHGRAQSMGKARRIAVQFALVDRRALVIVQKLDGIFDGDDVVVLLLIDAIQKHRKGRRLARAGRAGHEHDAITQLGDFGQLLGQVQSLKVGNCSRNDAHDHGTTAALNENVDAEAGQAGQSVGDVTSAVLPQRGDGLLVVADQVGGDVAGVISGQKSETRHLHGNHLAVNLDLRRTPGRENEVADFFCGAQHGSQKGWRGDAAASRKTFQRNRYRRNGG